MEGDVTKMKNIMYEEQSECCHAPVQPDLTKTVNEGKEIFLFICSKCKHYCHLVKTSHEETH